MDDLWTLGCSSSADIQWLSVMNSWLTVWIWCSLDPNLIEILYSSLVCLQLYKIERSDGRKEERAFEETQEGRNWMVAATWQPLVWCCCGNCSVTCVCNAVGLQLQWACWERMEKRESKWHTRHTAAWPGPAQPACVKEIFQNSCSVPSFWFATHLYMNLMEVAKLIWLNWCGTREKLLTVLSINTRTKTYILNPLKSKQYVNIYIIGNVTQTYLWYC